MPNPLRSEGTAFTFVLLTICFFAAIVIADVLLGPLAGLIVFVLLSAAGIWWLLRSRKG